MANGEINATDLTEETTSTLSGNEQFVMFDPVEGKRADIDEVAKYIAGDKTQLQTSEKSSVVGAINEVNGKAADLKEDLIGRKDAVNQSDWQNILLEESDSNTVIGATSSVAICTTKRLTALHNQTLRLQISAGYKHRVIFFSSKGNGNISTGVFYGTAQGDYDDLTQWHTNNIRTLQIPSDAVAYTVNISRIDGTSVSPSDCDDISMEISWGTDLISEIMSDVDYSQGQLNDNNAINVLSGFNEAYYTSFGVEIIYIGSGKYYIKGSATALVQRTIVGGNNVIPEHFLAGESYYVKGINNKIYLSITEYVNGVEGSTFNFYDDADYTVSPNVTGLRLRINVVSGAVVNQIVKPSITNAYTNKQLSDYLSASIKANKNVLSMASQQDETIQGITYTFSDKKCKVTGTANAISYKTLLGGRAVIPPSLSVGNLAKIYYSGENVALHFIEYDENQETIKSEFIYSDCIMPISENAKGIEIRLRVANGITVDETVEPIVINQLSESDLSKIEYKALTAINGKNQNLIFQCAKSYYEMTRANQYTYGERSALYYGEGAINQIHCGGLTALIASGCPFGSSRYANPNIANASYEAGYGFDFEAYSLRKAQAGTQSEIDYIGADNVNKTVAELKELMLFKTSYQLSTACFRWGMIKYIQDNGTIDFAQLEVGDILFYGNPDDGSQRWIDGKYIYPQLIEGNLISHCDTIIKIDNGTPYVINAGAAPVSIHAFNMWDFQYVCAGRVPLFDIVY